MAKTLMYVPGSPTSVKLGDTDTNLYLQVAKDNVNVDLTSVKSITVKIADANNNYLKDISIAPASLTSGNNGILTVPLNSDNIGGLNSGDYYFETWIVTTDNETEIYPDMNVTKFHVFNNLVGGTTILTTLTMQAFLDRITANQTASETSLSNSQTALANANIANTNAAKVLSDLNAGNYLTKDTLSNAPSFEALQTQVNNSAVGTNLLRCTKSWDSAVWTYGSTSYSISGDILTVDATSSSNYIDVTQSVTHISPSTTYTLGWNLFDQSTTDDRAMMLFAVEYQSDGSTTSNYSDHKLLLTADYNTNYRKSMTFTTQPDCASVKIMVRTQARTKDSIERMKLEKGSVATDWCPNPAEILTQSNYAKIQAAIVALGGSLS